MVSARMKGRPLQVWNIGLPRTGTTSTTAALRNLGLRCVPVVAQWVAMDIKNWEGFDKRTLKVNCPPVICTVRPFEPWAESVGRYFTNRATSELLRQVYQDHQKWLINLRIPVGMVDVSQGYSDLFHALSVGYDGVPMPHLNTGPSLDTKARLH